MDETHPSSSGRSVTVDGLKIRRVRQKLRWTQEDAAKNSGYSTRLIRKLESGASVERETLENIVMTYQEAIERNKVEDLPVSLRTIDFIVCNPKDAVERVAYQWFDRVFNYRDLSVIEELVHPDVILIAEGQSIQGHTAIRARLQAILDGFNPLKLCIERLVTEGNTTVVYWQVEAIHSGSFFGFAATGRSISIRGTTLAVIRDNKILEARDHWDAKHLIDQIS